MLAPRPQPLVPRFPNIHLPAGVIRSSNPLISSVGHPVNRDVNPLRMRDRKWFTCAQCYIPRDTTDGSVEDGVCVYCTDAQAGVDLSTEFKWCVQGDHKTKRVDLFRGDVERHACGRCASPPAGIDASPFKLDHGNPDAPAMSALDWARIKSFHKAEEALSMDTCKRCDERWFDMCLNSSGVRKRCASHDRKLRPGDPFLFSAANALDPGALPGHLPKLSQVEEMMVSRVHAHLEIHTVRGDQSSYTGHSVNILKDAAKVYFALPVAPEDLEIVMCLPTNAHQSPLSSGQFESSFVVRRANVHVWIQHLCKKHPGYKDIRLNREALSSLPENGNVMHRISLTRTKEVRVDDALDPSTEPSPPVVSAVPSVAVERADGLASGGAVPPRDVPGIFRHVPMSEFSSRHASLSLAFPTLFPVGMAEFNRPRMRAVTYAQYIEHLMKYKDGRFARHPRFRYVVFNQLMRIRINSDTAHLFSKPAANEADTLWSALGEHGGGRLLDLVLHRACGLRGTSSFWDHKNRELESHIHALGAPKLFLSFSFADLSWWSLARHMPRFERWQTATDAERLRISRRNLQDNPAIAAFVFRRRFGLFMEHCIMPKFCPDEVAPDYWNRYEWQSRGSAHNHGFIWAADAPNLPAITRASTITIP